VQMTCDASSFPRLLAIVGDPAASVDSRRFAQRWIDALRPGSRLRSSDTAPADAAQIEEAQAWWSEHSGDPEVVERIRGCNPPV